MHRYNICLNTMINQETFRQTEKGGRRWGHCLWLTQGGSAFKSLHHLHWFPFLRSGGFKDLHSCDVKREKWGRKSRTRAGDGGLSPPRSSSSPTASSLPVTQARQKGWGGLCEARLGRCHQTRDLLQNRSGHECLTLCLCHYNPRRSSFNASKHANTIIRTVRDKAACPLNTLILITLMRSTPKTAVYTCGWQMFSHITQKTQGCHCQNSFLSIYILFFKSNLILFYCVFSCHFNSCLAFEWPLRLKVTNCLSSHIWINQ